MSFQHFRLHPLTPQTQHTVVNQHSQSSLSQALVQPQQSPIPQPVLNNGGPTIQIQRVQNGVKKAPYGSGDADDGYTLVFASMEEFQEWRRKEEEEKMIEFVKGDTHGSKAVPPRFKDHTKLVCARHTRSGRKKYVKKYPDRVRKVPSRKVRVYHGARRYSLSLALPRQLEGTGCSASISYKTYFDTDEVRVCCEFICGLRACLPHVLIVYPDMSEHSHEIGLANLPFTKRGRKLQAEQQQTRARSRAEREDSESSKTPPPVPNNANAGPVAGPSSVSAPPAAAIPQSNAAPSLQTFQSAISMMPHQQDQQAQQPQAQQQSLAPHAPQPLTQERWDRMSVLFQGIRENARNFDYPAPSVAALESILIRLYLESPMGAGASSTPSHLPLQTRSNRAVGAVNGG